MDYSNAQIRNLLLAVFKDKPDFELLGDDYFEDIGPTPDEFSAQSNLKLKAQFLLKHAKQNNLLDKLLAIAHDTNPQTYTDMGFEPPTSTGAPPQPELLLAQLITQSCADAADISLLADDYFEDAGGVPPEIENEPDAGQKAQLLAQHAQQNNQSEKLLALVKESQPDKYQSFVDAHPELLAGLDAGAEADTESGSDAADASAPAADEPPEKPQGNPKVFISYSRRDEDFIKQLYQRLTYSGISAWYDRVDIPPGGRWRESIVEGIVGSELFLLVLSPDSMASDPVSREITLAQGEGKTILPIMWRQTDFPNRIKYQLAGIQYIDVAETASDENFNRVITAVNKLLGGEAMEDAVSQENMVASEESPVPASAKQARGAKRRRMMEVQATRRLVASSLIAPMQLDDDKRDQYSVELGWLFSAADHLLQIRRGDVSLTSPVPTPIPPNAKKDNSSNKVASDLDEFSLKLIEGQVEGVIRRLNIHIRNLNYRLRQQAYQGGPMAIAVGLHNSIDNERRSIAEGLQELVELMYQVYGARISVANELLYELPAAF